MKMKKEKKMNKNEGIAQKGNFYKIFTKITFSKNDFFAKLLEKLINFSFKNSFFFPNNIFSINF